MDFEDDRSEAENALPDFLRDPLGIPQRRWPWMLAGLVLGLVATAAAVNMTVPVYRATASILVSSQYIPEDFVRTTVREDPFSHLNALVSQVLSRSKLAALIEKHDLYSGIRERLPLGEVVNHMRGDIGIRAEEAVQRSRHRRGPESARIYLITFDHVDPGISSQVSNALAGFFLEAGMKSRMERATGITKFLQTELLKAERDLAAENARIAEYKEQYRGELPDELESNLSRLERLESQRDSASRQLMEAQSQLTILSSAVEETPDSPSARLRAARAQLDIELAVNTPEHPNVLSLRRQVEALEAEVKASGPSTGERTSTSRQGLVATLQNTIMVTERDITKHEAEMAELDTRVGRTGKHQEQLDAMAQRATVLRENYLDFLRKVEEAELAQTLESHQYGAQISLMDPAQPPSRPTSSRLQLAALGVVASVGLSILLGLVFEFLNPLIIDARQVEALSGLPVLGSIQRIS